MVAGWGKPGVNVVAVLVIALALGAGWWAAALRPDTRPQLAAALDVLPASTNIVGFTDWKQIRASLGLGTVDTAAEREGLATESASRDLATRSVFRGEVEEMHDVLGWSPANLDWEVYGQDPGGSAAVVRLDRSVSFDDVRARLDKAGFKRDGELWKLTQHIDLPDLIAQVALVPRQRLLVMSNTRGKAPQVLDVIRGRARSLAADHQAAATAHALAGSDSVILQGGTLGCGSTVVPDDADLQRQARSAVEQAGGLRGYGYSGRGIAYRGGSGFSAEEVVFAMTFDSAAAASEQARVRARLATGPFIGRIGEIEETLRLRTSTHDGSTVRMAFDHDPDTDVFMTGTGPVLFATC